MNWLLFLIFRLIANYSYLYDKEQDGLKKGVRLLESLIEKFLCRKNLSYAVELSLRPYSETLLAWFASNCQDNSRLLRGQALEDAKKWAANQTLTEQDYLYLTASQELEKQEMAAALVVQEEESRILAQANNTLNIAQKKAKHQIRIGGAVLICSLIGAIAAGVSTNIANNQLQ